MSGVFYFQLLSIYHARSWLGYTSQQAYLCMSGEQEVYCNHHDENYLEQRKRGAQWRYLKNKIRIKVGSDGNVEVE